MLRNILTEFFLFIKESIIRSSCHYSYRKVQMTCSENVRSEKIIMALFILKFRLNFCFHGDKCLGRISELEGWSNDKDLLVKYKETRDHFYIILSNISKTYFQSKCRIISCLFPTNRAATLRILTYFLSKTSQAIIAYSCPRGCKVLRAAASVYVYSQRPGESQSSLLKTHENLNLSP